MMKFSTKARYGLRLMVELARELKTEKLVRLGKIARITGLSENYLAQLAIPLKNQGILIGISGKNGGYCLSRKPEKIKLREIVEAVAGPICITDCVNHPDICLNSSFCEARTVWVIVSGGIMEVLDRYSLAELIEKKRLKQLRKQYSHLPLLDSDRLMSESDDHSLRACAIRQNKSPGS